MYDAANFLYCEYNSSHIYENTNKSLDMNFKLSESNPKFSNVLQYLIYMVISTK